MKQPKLLLAMSLVAWTATQAQLPVSYDANKYRSEHGQSDPGLIHIGKEAVHFEVTDTSKNESYLRSSDKIVTVSFRNGSKRKYVLSDNALYRLEDDKSMREILLELGEMAFYLTMGGLLGATITAVMLDAQKRR